MATELEQPSRRIEAAISLKVAINRGDSGRLKHMLDSSDPEELLDVKDQHGNTALHVAVGINYVHIIRQLIDFQPKLCYCTNNDKATTICIVVELGHLKALKELIRSCPDAIKEPNCCGMNVLHLATLVSQVRIVDYLNKTKTVDLSESVNQGLETPPYVSEGAEDPPIPLNYPSSKVELLGSGDTPLHIAARTKNFHMVVSLMNIKGIDKEALNVAGLTALDISRENTEYHKSYRIIALLVNHPPKRRPFLYSAPKVSALKYQNAINMVDKTYDGRRNIELVVAVLLATMSFTAIFTVPGGFKTDVKNGETNKMLGMPIMIGIESFKLFLIFYCLAFFVSLFVVLMWQMSTPLTIGHKVLFLIITNLLVCASFAFTAYGFMAAVYTMVAHKRQKLAWVLFWACFVISFTGNVVFFYMAAMFSVKLARFNFLRGVHPFLRDRALECVWLKLESVGALDYLRWCKTRYINWLYRYSLEKAGTALSVDESKSTEVVPEGSKCTGKSTSCLSMSSQNYETLEKGNYLHDA